MRSIVFCFSLLLFASPMLAQDARRAIVSTPSLQPPPEAVQTGLGGRISVEVEVDKTGAVRSVKGAYGPGWVCPAIKRPDVLALRETATTLAKLVKFAPAAKGSNEWIGINFPSKKEDDPDEAVSGGAAEADAPPAGGVTVNRIRPNPKMIKGGVVNGKAKVLPKPPYPPEARAARAAGAVSIQVLIDEDGTVFSAQPISGDPLLQGVSRAAACAAEFSPTKFEGNPVKVSGVITYNFVY